MTVTVNIHQAKTQLVIIAKSGKPWAKLVPIRDDAARRPGVVKCAVTAPFVEPLTEEELDAWA